MTNEKKVSKFVKKRLIIFGPISLFMCLFFCFTLTTNTIKIKKLSLEKQKLETELTQLKEKEEKLSSQITKYKDSEYAAKYAIESWHVTKDGIIALIMEDEKLNDEIDASNYEGNIYKRTIVISIIIVLIFVLLMGVINKKKKTALATN